VSEKKVVRTGEKGRGSFGLKKAKLGGKRGPDRTGGRAGSGLSECLLCGTLGRKKFTGVVEQGV